MKDVILYRYFDNEADADEIRQIEAWLAADPEHQREFDAAHMIYNALLLEQARRAAAADA